MTDLQHILPKNFQHIRHFGFLANACRQKALSLIRTALAVTAPETEEQNEEVVVVMICPHCKKGHLIPHHELMPLHYEQWMQMHPS